MFLPVVAGQGGIAGTQTLTLVVRSIALGIVVAVAGIAWKGDPTLGLILGVAMLGNLPVAGVVGSGVPLLLRKLGQDPAVSAAVAVTTATAWPASCCSWGSRH